MSTEIEIENIGPIKSLEITLPDSGVVVLKGSHGSGKSTALRAVQRRMGGPGPDLSVHDGAKKGVLSLGEARLSVTKSRTSTLGELEILGIESDLDIGSLVDPGIADHEKADAKRIKALISLAGVEPDPTIFHPIVGGEAQYVALGIDDKGADVLTLAARVKRALESLARSREEVADSYAERARAAKKASEDAPEGEANEKVLAETLAAAQSKLDAAKAENKRRDEGLEAARIAQKQLVELGELAEDPAALFNEIKALNTRVTEGVARIAQIDEQIKGLNESRNAVERDISDWEDAVDALAKRRDKAADAVTKRLELSNAAAKAVPLGYGEPFLTEAIAAVDAARKAVENGALIRQAAAKAAEAESHATAAKVASKAARKLRDAAGAVDDALSKLLPDDCPLRVEAGRLVLETDRGKSEPFSDLSEGEKWQVAIRVACKKLPPGGLLTLEQSAWEGLAPSVKLQLDAEAKAQGVVILTAAVDDGELRAETIERHERLHAEGLNAETPGDVA